MALLLSFWKLSEVYKKKKTREKVREPTLAHEERLKGSFWNLFWVLVGGNGGAPQPDVIHLVILSIDIKHGFNEQLIQDEP